MLSRSRHGASDLIGLNVHYFPFSEASPMPVNCMKIKETPSWKPRHTHQCLPRTNLPRLSFVRERVIEEVEETPLLSRRVAGQSDVRAAQTRRTGVGRSPITSPRPDDA